MFSLDQILVDLHWTKSNKDILEKEMKKQKLAWLVGYIALCANRNIKSPFQLLPQSDLVIELSKR